METMQFKRIGLSAVFSVLLLAPSIALGYGTCNIYINADGTVQANRGEGDCAVMPPTRVGIGVYTVGVSYPVVEEADPATGAAVYTFHAGICTASVFSDHTGASSVKMYPDAKPTSYPRRVPQGHNGLLTYTVRTFAATPGPTLVPADQDFSMICIN
ncbi:hypothetical protein [Lysobacter sp. CA199]|uniref:hypothetical protein n=1 Tax=Lysobacter sp. CA199 TaxID=3455608 RepID=UPI003F8D7867